MDITPRISTKNKVIQSYGPSGIKISGEIFTGPVLVMPLETTPLDLPDLGALDRAPLDPAVLDLLAPWQDDIDILLVGTGARPHMLSPALRSALKDRKIAVEAMDTGAACRTYNVLMSDGRNVAALLLPVA